MARSQKQQKQPQDPNSGLPSSPETERAVLGMIFLNELTYHELVSLGIQLEYFCYDSNRKIFGAIQGLVQAQKQPDLVMVVDELERRAELANAGGVAYIAALVDGVPDVGGTGSLADYVGILREKYMRRKAIQSANSIASCAMDPGDPIRQTIALATEDLLRLQGETTKAPAEFVGASTAAVLDEVSELMYVEREVIGIPFGVQDLDTSTTGLRVGEITTVGAYPGNGKTAFALNVSRLAVKDGFPVAFFSLEMTKKELILRLLAQESDIAYSKLRNPRNLHTSERHQLDFWVEKINGYPLLIDDHVRTIEELIPRAHLYIRKHKIKLIAIDYLQLIQAPGDSEYDRVSAASDAIWWLEKTTQVPILCLSQLNRPEGRSRGTQTMPTLHSLRSSGKIEQNTHNVLLLHRHYNDDGVPTGDDTVIIAKQRAGVVGRVKSFFNGSAQRWENRNPISEPQQPTIFSGKEVTQ